MASESYRVLFGSVIPVRTLCIFSCFSVPVKCIIVSRYHIVFVDSFTVSVSKLVLWLDVRNRLSVIGPQVHEVGLVFSVFRLRKSRYF